MLAVFGPPSLRGNSKPRMCGSGPLRGLRNAHVELGSTGGLHVWRKPTYMSSGQPAGCPRALRNPVSRPVPPTVWPFGKGKLRPLKNFWFSQYFAFPMVLLCLFGSRRGFRSTVFFGFGACALLLCLPARLASASCLVGSVIFEFCFFRQRETTASEKFVVFTGLCFSHGFAVSSWSPDLVP